MVFQEENNEYRIDGFVVGDDEVSENEQRRRKGSRENKRKRLRKAREEHGMEAADDEDLELIREAQGVRCVCMCVCFSKKGLGMADLTI